MTTAFYRRYELAWELAPEQEARFHRTLRNTVLAVLVAAIVLSLLPVPESPPDKADPVPPRFAKLLLEKQKPPPAPAVKKRAEPRPEPVAPKIAEQKPKEVTKPVAPEPRESARDRAAKAGLLPFVDQLAELRDNQAIARVTKGRDLAGAAGDSARVERSLITSKAGRASGGISTAGLSRDTGGAGLADHETTAVSSTVAGLAPGAPARRSGESDLPSRSREEIEMVFDRNKGAIYALYNRALRRDPTLQGKLVLRLTIEPSGSVSLCEIVSSDIEDEELEHKLVRRIKLFRFKKKDVLPVTTTKPIDFFPA